MRQLYISLFISILFLSGLFTVKSFAESLAVSLRVGITHIAFDGYSSPGSFITITQNDAVIGTTLVDGSGNWSKTIELADPGVQTFKIFATDSNNLTTPTISYTVNLQLGTLTEIGDIVLPPTISLSDLTLTGQTHPLATLTLMSSSGITSNIAPDSSGNWSYLLTTTTPGSYTVYIIANMPGNHLSLESQVIPYTIASPASSPSTSTSPSSTTSPSPSPLATPTGSLSPLLIQKNQDLLSVLQIFTPKLDLPLITRNLEPIVIRWITFWQAQIADEPLPGGSCDLNQDSSCDLVDLSILLYYIEP